MERLIPVIVIMVSGLLVALADVLIKKAAVGETNLWSVVKNPLMIPVVIIYALAILSFCFAFIKKWDLGIIGLLQIIIYAAFVIIAGVVFFDEKITFIHGFGMVLAVAAAALMTA